MRAHGVISVIVGLITAIMVALVRRIPEQLLIDSVWDAQAPIAHLYSLVACAVLFGVTWPTATLLAAGLMFKKRSLTAVGVVGMTAILAFVGFRLVRFYGDHRAMVDSADPTTPVARLTALSDYQTMYFGYELDNRIASHPNTPVEVLRKLHARNNLGTLMCLSRNPNTPPDLLAKLADDPDEWIQKGLAENPNWKPQAHGAAQPPQRAEP